MKSIRVLAVITFSVCALAAPSGLWAGDEDEAPEATLVEHKGTVEWSSGTSDEDRWLPVEDGQGLHAGDQVRTGPKSRVKISMGVGVEIRLGSKSTVEIQQFEQDTSRHNSIALLLGVLTAKVEKAIGVERSFEVHTGTAVAGVRGTEFTTVVGLDGTVRTSVQEGRVEFEAEEGSADLKPGQFSEANLGGSASSPTAVPKAFDLEDWLEKRRQAALADPDKAARRMLDQAATQHKRLVALLDRNQELASEIDGLARKARLARRSGQRKAVWKLRAKLRGLVVEAIQVRRASRRVATRLVARVKWLRQLSEQTAASKAGEATQKPSGWIAESRQLTATLRGMKRKHLREVRNQVRHHRRLVRSMKLQLRDVTQKQRQEIFDRMRRTGRGYRGK